MISSDRFPDTIPEGRLPAWYGWHCGSPMPAESEAIGGVRATLTQGPTGTGVTYELAEAHPNGFTDLAGSMPRSFIVRPR